MNHSLPIIKKVLLLTHAKSNAGSTGNKSIK